MYKAHRIAVVMPIHNEEKFIERAIARVPGYVDWIIAIDDGSTDRTGQRLSQIQDGRLVLLHHEKNSGVGAATKTGYHYALQCAVDFIAVMDGDGQMHGDDLCRLLDAAIDGADFVKGNRFMSQTVSCMPLARYVGNRFFSFLTRQAVAFGNPLDAQCGYTVIRRAALERVQLDGLYNRYGFPNEMFFAAHRSGLRIENVAVRAVYEDEVSGINPFTALPTILFLIVRSYFRQRRLSRSASSTSGRETRRLNPEPKTAIIE